MGGEEGESLRERQGEREREQQISGMRTFFTTICIQLQHYQHTHARHIDANDVVLN